MLNVGIVSLGCPKNLVDTENVLGNLSKYGVNIVNNPKLADIIIINTCGFIESAKVEAIDTILEMSEYKKIGNCKSLIVIGCLAQRYKEEIYKDLPEVDMVFGLNEYNELISTIVNKSVLFSDEYRILSTKSHVAYLKIADGCDNKCTYCAIPMIRGKFISRPKEEIIKEAKKLVKNGVKELILVAQDTTKYGIDLYKKYELPNLIRELCKIDDLKWIRLMYTYPELITDELIQVFKTEDKVCNYIDMPLQHINNRVLKLMNRRSNKEKIYTLINKLKENIPNISLRTSLIVGFPSETEEEFEELVEFVKVTKFDRLGVFKYCAEEGTPAESFENQIENNIKEKRQKHILEIQQQISKINNQKFIGKKIEILIEEEVKKNLYIGRTYRDAIEIDGLIYVSTDETLTIGDFYNVEVVDSKEYDLYAKF